MPIVAADLIFYGALNRPEDDVGTSGGGIDVDHRPTFTPLAANDEVEIVSDNGGDTTQNVTITGRNAAGEIVEDTEQLAGATPVVFSGLGVLERILKIVMSADAAGIVTIRRDGDAGDIADIPPGERGVFRMFIDSTSTASPEIRWEKVFGLNAHGTLSLTNAEIELTADPSDVIRVGVAATKDDTGSVSNRKTGPGVTFVDDNVAQSVPSGNLAAGEAIGVWIEQALDADNVPLKSSFTLQLAGNTT